MTIKTWKKEFYKVKAETFKFQWSKTASAKPIIKATENALLKWTGFLKKNLKKHEVHKCAHNIIDKENNVFATNFISCSFCQMYFCTDCPITNVTGNNCHIPWMAWLIKDDPKPMICVLKQTLKYYKEIK